MKKLIALFSFITILAFTCSTIVIAQEPTKTATAAKADTLSDDALNETGVADTTTAKTPATKDAGEIEQAKELSRDTRGPVASICYQGLLRIDDSIENIERSVTSYGSVQSANLEKGCSWITLFIAMAPSLGFLGTVIGMVMAFDQIQEAGDISPTIVAAGMKVALITTIFGIIVALVLQVFYNYILSKIEHITAQMEESAISLLDSIMKYKLKRN